MEYPKSIDLDVRIGKRDIAKGCKGQGDNCPGALAILRAANKAFPGQDLEVYVGTHDATLCFVEKRAAEADNAKGWGTGEAMELTGYEVSPSPKVLRDFVNAFDGDDDVEPVSFKLHFEKEADL